MKNGCPSPETVSFVIYVHCLLPLKNIGELPVKKKKKYATRHIAMPTTSITSFSVHLHVLLRHDVPTTSRKPSPTVQLWQDSWCPNSPKTQTPEISSLSGEDKEQQGMPIKAQRIHRKEDGKNIIGDRTQRRENKRERERAKRGRKTREKQTEGKKPKTEGEPQQRASTLFFTQNSSNKLRQQVSFHCFPSLAV